MQTFRLEFHTRERYCKAVRHLMGSNSWTFCRKGKILGKSKPVWYVEFQKKFFKYF